MWKLVEDNESLELLLDESKGLHDSLLHEAVFQSTGFVDDEGNMHGDTDLPSLRIVFQSQFPEVVGLEVRLLEVTRFRLDFDKELNLEGELRQGLIVLYPFGKEEEEAGVIQAASLRYRMLGPTGRGREFHLSLASEFE